MEGMIKRSVMIASNTLSLQEDRGRGVFEGKHIISGVGAGHPSKKRPHRDEGKKTHVRHVIRDIHHVSKGQKVEKHRDG